MNPENPVARGLLKEPMNDFLSECLRTGERPFLQNPQCWKFFIEAAVVGSHQWLGTVHIHTGVGEITSLVRCTESRGTSEEALIDAKALAEMTFIKIGVRLMAVNELERLRNGMAPD